MQENKHTIMIIIHETTTSPHILEEKSEELLVGVFSVYIHYDRVRCITNTTTNVVDTQCNNSTWYDLVVSFLQCFFIMLNVATTDIDHVTEERTWERNLMRKCIILPPIVCFGRIPVCVCELCVMFAVVCQHSNGVAVYHTILVNKIYCDAMYVWIITLDFVFLLFNQTNEPTYIRHMVWKHIVT
jgi:hypothetical protein